MSCAGSGPEGQAERQTNKRKAQLALSLFKSYLGFSIVLARSRRESSLNNKRKLIKAKAEKKKN
jgi:hypothetical protein